MDPQQTALVQSTFERATRLGPHFSATFYSELFVIDPSLRRLFSGDMIRQGEQLMLFLAHIVYGIDRLDEILPAVRDLGARHVGYGVEARHYAMVGTALIRTFRHELGADFTPEARQAWTAAYKLMSDAMCEAAYGVSASPAASLQR
jgi:hemoglobin-like flavoprotein